MDTMALGTFRESKCDQWKIKRECRDGNQCKTIFMPLRCRGGPNVSLLKASAEALVAVEAIAGKEKADTLVNSHCVYTSRRRRIGISKGSTRKRKVKMFTFPTSFNGKSLAEGETEGFVLLNCSSWHRRLLGAQVVCAHASELIGIIGSAMQSEACVEDLEEMILPHPSVSESIGEAAAEYVKKYTYDVLKWLEYKVWNRGRNLETQKWDNQIFALFCF